MSLTETPSRPPRRERALALASKNTVNRTLTPKRRRRVVENDEYAAFLRRVIAAYSRRVAAGDIDAITGMAATAELFDAAIHDAITSLRAHHGYSWADIAARLGITRQGAQQRWGSPASNGHRDT